MKDLDDKKYIYRLSTVIPTGDDYYEPYNDVVCVSYDKVRLLEYAKSLGDNRIIDITLESYEKAATYESYLEIDRLEII